MDQKQNQQFFSLLERGYIALNQLIEFAMVMFGMAKRGKTTLAHYLTGQPLKGCGDAFVYYKAISTGSKYKNAKIGDTPHSETQIPNYFKIILSKNQDITLIDCPGFHDSRGCHKIITNGYFNYQVFSKVKNMKFILVVEKQDLQNDALMFHKALTYFFDCFSNVEDYLDDILDATCLIVNKSSIKKQDNYQKLKILRQFKPNSLSKKNYNLIIEFIDNMVSKKKVYGFKKARQNILAPTYDNPFLDILVKTKYWTRNISIADAQLVNMSLINFPIMKEIQQNRQIQQFWKQWTNLIEYFHARTKAILRQGLRDIFSQIIEDAVSLNQQQCYSIQKMRTFSAKWGRFCPSLETQRNYLIANLFIKRQLNSEPIKKQKKLYWIRKMQLLDDIYTQFWELSDEIIKRNYQEINAKQERILKLIRKLDSIVKNRNEQQVIIPYYGYMIFRFFEDVKVFFLLFNGRQSNHILDGDNQLDYILNQKSQFDFFYRFREAISAIIQIQITQIKKKFALSYQIQDSLNPEDYSDILKFYNSVTIQSRYLNQQEKRNLTVKQLKLVLKSSAYCITNIYSHFTQRCKAIIDLNAARKKLERQNILMKPQDIQKIETNTKYLILLVRNMGQLFQINKEFQIARKCYISINLVSKVLQVFQKQVMMEYCTQIKRHILIQMGKYANEIGRHQLAIQKFQQAYCMSFQVYQFNQLANMIFQANNKKKSKVYLNNVMKAKIYVPLSPENCKSIQQYCKKMHLFE